MPETRYRVTHAYKRIQAFKSRMFAKGSPVVLLGGNLLADKISGKTLLFAKFGNAGEITITALFMDVKCFDEQDNISGVIEDFGYFDLNAAPADSFGGKIPAEMPVENIKRFEIILNRAYFSDGQTWENSSKNMLEAVPVQKKLKEVLHSKLFSQFLHEYKIRYEEEYKFKLTEFFPLQTEDYWLCTCGQLNLPSNAVCCGCDCEKAFTFEYTDPPTLERLSEQYEAGKKEQKIEKEEEKQSKKSTFFNYAKIIAGAAAAVIILLIVNAKVVQLPLKYESGKKAYEAGNYNKAVGYLEQIPKYKDSSKIIVTATRKILSTAKAGDTVIFGSYEQDNNILNGKESIAWRVLAVQNGKALLISEKNLDCLPYDNQQPESMPVSVSWEACSLRKWLNNDFINAAFTANEQAAIAKTNFSDTFKKDDGTMGESHINDKMFLLSVEDAVKYFKSDENRMSINTKYAQSKWKDQNILPDLGGSWWLRTPEGNGYALYVRDTGSLYQEAYDGTNDESLMAYAETPANDTGIAVRPAMWVDFSN